MCFRKSSRKHPFNSGYELAPHALNFLSWAIQFHDPFWLTTRDAHGSHDGILRAFRLAIGTTVLPRNVDHLVRAIKPTKWNGRKTSGIDFSLDFIWIDDCPLQCDIDVLVGYGMTDRLFIVNTNIEDHGLSRFMELFANN